MSHTNSTANYNLPQFIATDTPGWMTDVNGAMQNIDSAVHDNAVAIGTNTGAISAIETELSEMLPTSGNVNALLQKTATGAQWSNLVDIIYPVGSVYMSTSAVDPSTIFGGTWSKIEDHFLMAAGSVYPNGSTGGSATKTLTNRELPAHHHGFRHPLHSFVGSGNGSGGIGSGNSWAGTDAPAFGGNYTNDMGDGQPFSILPPYLAVNVWVRNA